MTLSEEQDDLLHREADLIARYLVGREPGAELAERYARADRALFGPGATPREEAVVAFCRRHPWALPLLDAAAGLVAPRSLLRKKVLLMTAVLEATPDFVDDFLPETFAPGRFVLRGAGLGLTAACKAGLGIVLWPFVRSAAP